LKKYIRYSNNKYLVTENNWENVVSKTEFNLSDYSLENDQDNVYKAKLIYEIGKAKSMLILNELQKIRELLEKKGFPSPTSDGFGNAFEVFALSVIHNLDYDSVLLIILY